MILIDVLESRMQALAILIVLENNCCSFFVVVILVGYASAIESALDFYEWI